ncbi:MAG: 30S ribosomal protein S27ae [Candidatus Freyrarchaeum guaymaensis]
MSKYYKINGDKVERLKIQCPRCGQGVWMAEHYDRYACGKCGYTEFKKRKSQAEKSSG